LSLSGPSLTRFTALTLLACVAAASTLALVGPNVDLPLTDLRQRQAPPLLHKPVRAAQLRATMLHLLSGA